MQQPDLFYIMEAFMTRQKKRGSKPSTIHWYRNKLSNFLGFATLRGELTSDVVDHFLKEVLHCSSEGRKGYWRAIRAMILWAAHPANALLSPHLLFEYDPKFPKTKRIIAPSREQIEALLARTTTDTLSNHRDRCLWHLLYFGGIRIGEALSIRVDDIDLERRFMHVFQEKVREHRIMPIANPLMSELTLWLDRNKSEWLFPSVLNQKFGKRLSLSGAEDHWRKFQKRTGYPAGGRHIRLHMLRHAFGMHAREAGLDLVDIKDLLGHASLQATQIYAVATPEMLRRRIDRIW